MVIYVSIKMLVGFFVVAALIDNTLPDHFTLPYKILAGLLSSALILFISRKMKSVVLRTPIKR